MHQIKFHIFEVFILVAFYSLLWRIISMPIGTWDMNKIEMHPSKWNFKLLLLAKIAQGYYFKLEVLLITKSTLQVALKIKLTIFYTNNKLMFSLSTQDLKMQLPWILRIFESLVDLEKFHSMLLDFKSI